MHRPIGDGARSGTRTSVEPETPVAVLTGIRVYPVKSAAGIEADRWEVDAFGFRHDRRWMLVDARGRFMTQRHHPRMALIRPAITGDALELAAPGMPELTLPLEPEVAASRSVRVWSDEVAAADAGEVAARWLSGFLGVACRLLYMPADVVRPVDPRYAVVPGRIGFADGYPFLLLSEESLDGLNRRLAEPLPMNRFRPNLIVRGAGEHAEDGWRRIRIGGIELHVVKPCARCAITATDQATGRRGSEPLRTLATYRARDGHVWFGQNVIHTAPGVLAVGHAVLV